MHRAQANMTRGSKAVVTKAKSRGLQSLISQTCHSEFRLRYDLSQMHHFDLFDEKHHVKYLHMFCLQLCLRQNFYCCLQAYAFCCCSQTEPSLFFVTLSSTFLLKAVANFPPEVRFLANLVNKQQDILQATQD